MFRLCRQCQTVGQLGRQLKMQRQVQTSSALLAVQLKMPSLSPTMTEGTIVKWLKNEGDKVEAGDVVCDIQTDKAVVSMEIDDEGTLAKILIKADSGSIKVGELIAIIAEEGEDWKTVTASDIPSSSDSSPSPTEDAPSFTGGSVEGTVINMPSLSPTMSEGTIVKWYKKEGDAIASGELLCDIQTDKAVVSMEADDEGILAKILIGEGSSGVEVGRPIAIFVGEGEDWKDVAIPVVGSAPAVNKQADTPAPSAGDKAPAASAAVAAPVGSLTFVHPAQTGPATALLLTSYGIKPTDVQGSGPKGNILKADVLNHIASKNLKQLVETVPLPGADTAKDQSAAKDLSAATDKATTSHVRSRVGHTDIELTNMRKVIAKRLTDSKQMAPHGYSSATASIDKLMRFRQMFVKSGHKVSVNDFVVKAVALALQYVPELNVNIIKEEPVIQQQIDVSVAVATPAGLITPIVKNASAKSIQEISAEVKELAGRARENKLKLDEFQGGTFTISNLGMFGIAEFTAIINAPQAAILAVGGGRQIINPDTMKAETVMTATLSFDRRFIDEALAADFMTVYKNLLENPELLGAGYLASVRLDRSAAAHP